MVDARRFERASRGRDKPAAFCFGKEMLRRDARRSESAQVPLDVGLGRVPVSNSDSSDRPPALMSWTIRQSDGFTGSPHGRNFPGV